jgi:hypothetical protein
MSKTGRINHRRGNRGRPKAERHITVRSVRKDPPDLRKLSRAVIAIALREAELDAEAKAGTAGGPTKGNTADGISDSPEEGVVHD